MNESIHDMIARLDAQPRTTKGTVLLTTPEWDAIKAEMARVVIVAQQSKYYSAEQRAAILTDYMAGDKLEVIVENHGCSLSYPSYLARRAGIDPRPTNGPNGRAGVELHS